MKRKKIRGITGVLCGVAMAVLALAACSRKAEVAQQSVTDDMSEHYVYSYAALNWGQLNGTDFNSDVLAQHFTKKFNFEWDVIQSTWADWSEKARIWINSGDMPDFVFDDFNFTDYKNWADQDLLKRFPDGWKTTYPNLAKVFNNTVLGPAMEDQVEGNMAVFLNTIFFNKPTNPKVAPHYSLFFRKDWASALGFEIKDQYTLKEVTAMIEKFMAEGSSLPGVARGKTDTFNLDTGRVSQVFLTSQWADATRFYKDASGKYIWGPDDPKTFELVRTMKSAIDRGIISKNFASFKNEEQDGLFYSGQAFALFTHGWVDYVYRDWTKFRTTTGLDPFECIQEAVITDPDGNYQEYEQLNYWSCQYFNPKMSDAKMARLLSILDYIASDEGQEIIRLGFEGKDYTKSGDTITITRPKDENGNFLEVHNIYPGAGLYSHTTMCPDNFALNSPAIPVSFHTPPRTMYATKQRIGIDTGTLRNYNFELYFFSGPNYLKFNTDVGGEIIRVCMMDGDLKANYDQWLKDIHPVVDPILAELNAAYGK
jgi:putative aldouronate transport system substrate-binding protein